jgi:hypothetical protein
MKTSENRKEYNGEYYKKNREKIIEQVKNYAMIHSQEKKEYLKKWRFENKDYMRKYRFENKEKINADLRKSRKEKRANDINYRVYNNIRSRLHSAMRSKNVMKNNKTLELLGCDLQFFRSYLEKQMCGGLTWDNYGSIWWFDHRIPTSWFDLSTLDEQKKAFNFKNYKPMLKLKNISKQDRFAEPSLVQIFENLEVKK